MPRPLPPDALTGDLFAGDPAADPDRLPPGPPRWLTDGALLLPGHARARAGALLAAVAGVLAEAPLRHLMTPGGLKMSVAMSNCGALGWVSDRQGYRYQAGDPLRDGAPWPAMPVLFAELAHESAALAGFPGFAPDACLINHYAPGARLTLHQDRDEQDTGQPIVSVSMGLPARFLFGGRQRSDPCQRLSLQHGDVLVWGGPARLNFHGVQPLQDGRHTLTGAARINLTFRRAS